MLLHGTETAVLQGLCSGIATYRLQGLDDHPQAQKRHGEVVDCDKSGNIDRLASCHQPFPDGHADQVCRIFLLSMNHTVIVDLCDYRD